jgi:hypothetical protein
MPAVPDVRVGPAGPRPVPPVPAISSLTAKYLRGIIP